MINHNTVSETSRFFRDLIDVNQAKHIFFIFNQTFPYSGSKKWTNAIQRKDDNDVTEEIV